MVRGGGGSDGGGDGGGKSVRGREREGGKGACQLGPRRATSRATPEFSPSLAGTARHGRATLTLLHARRSPERSISGGPAALALTLSLASASFGPAVVTEDAETVIKIDDNNCRAPYPARPPVTSVRTIDCRLSRARDRANEPRHLAGIVEVVV